jgi:hypothetical protein
MKIILSSSRRRHVARAIIFLILLALVTGMAGCDGGGGDGGGYPTLSPSQNLEIRTWYDLNDIRDNLAGNHTLMNDLDSTTDGYQELASPTANGGKGWQPVRIFHPYDPTAYTGFMGTFDGQGYEIHDLFINRPDEGVVGLFGLVGEEGVIKDIGVVNFAVIGDYCVGGLVGGNRGTVSNSYSSGNVTGRSRVGGLFGVSSGTVSNSYSTGTVAGEWDVGGLVGVNPGTVNHSYSTGIVTGEWAVGGLVGENYDTVNNSYSTGSVIGNSRVGGFVGQNLFGGTVNNCYSTGSVIGKTDVGGLVGDTVVYGTVSNSYYDRDEVLINGEHIITIGALFGEDFEEWLANNRFLDVNERLSQENGYCLINAVSDFKQLLAFGQSATLKFRLANDLDLATEPNFYIPYLAGEFDGNGHKISNVSLNFDLISPLGLFGYLAPGGKVTQVGVENVNVTGYSGVGGLVGDTCEGTVSHSYSTGSVTGNDAVGSLMGHSNFGAVSDCYSSGSVTGDVSVGGLIGGNGGTVDRSYTTSSVTGQEQVGGLVGSHGQGTVSNSYSTGSVTGNMHAGGLVGLNFGLGIVSNSYSTGSVTGDEYVGGLIGSNGDRGTVTNCYSAGRVSGNSYVGGLVGHNYFGTGKGTVSNCFWDRETSGQTRSDGGTGKTTAEMQEIATFSGAGWNIIAVALDMSDLSYTWNIIDKQTYPFLSWES